MPWRPFACVAHGFEFAGDVDDRLRGDAAADEAGAAEAVGLDEHGVDAELAGADRGDVAARAAADDEEFGFDVSRSCVSP